MAGRYNLNNTQTALDKSISARAVLFNEKRHLRMARSERGFFDSIPRPNSEQFLRRFVLDTEEWPPRRAIVKQRNYNCIFLSFGLM